MYMYIHISYTHREKERERLQKENGFLFASVLRFFTLSLPLVYTQSATILFVRRHRGHFVVQCLMQTQLGGTFNLSIQRCLLNLKIKTQLEYLLL